MSGTWVRVPLARDRLADPLAVCNMSQGAGVDRTLSGSVIFCLFVYALFSALFLTVWGRAAPAKDVIAVHYGNPIEYYHMNRGGRSPARLEREVRIAREEPVSPTGTYNTESWHRYGCTIR